MKNIYNITKDQESILNSYKCSRLSLLPNAKHLLTIMKSRRGAELIKYLRVNGLSEDNSGITAFYIVLNEKDYPLAFFSLKCGLLYLPVNEDNIKEELCDLKTINDVLKGKNIVFTQNIVLKFNMLETYAKDNNITLKQALALLKNNTIEFKTRYQDDKILEKNNSILQVHTTFPGIEISHFCVNDNARSEWDTLKLNHSIGEIVFWKFVLDKIIDVKNVSGCQYAYLFAADQSEERTLISYYYSLRFKKPGNVGTTKPRYDYCCELLIQDINTLIDYRKDFFSNFNYNELIELQNT